MAIKMPENLLLPQKLVLIIILPLLALSGIVEKLFTNRSLDRFYVSTPYPGKQKSWLSWLQATLESVFGAADQIKEGYAKYGKSDIPFIIPNIRKGPVLVLPPAHLKTVLSNTESKLAAHSAQAEAISSKYTIRDPEVQPTNFHVGQLRKTTTKRLGEVAEELADEVSFAFDAVWGTSKEWKTIVAISSFEEINDVLQWAMEQTPTNKDPKQITPRLIAHRLVLFTFSAIDASSIALFHALVDLYSAPPSEGFVDALREECNTVFRETGAWTKDAVSRLVLLDSTIRESMRLSDFGWTAFDRKVVSPTGIRISPSITVPKGVQIQVPMHCIHMDPDFHPNPTHFHPFRFAPPSSLPTTTTSSSSSSSPTTPTASNPIPDPFTPPSTPTPSDHPPKEEKENTQAKPLVTLDPHFLGWGFRQNACPGRWIAAHLMKVIMANVLMKYEVDVVEVEGKRGRGKAYELMEFRIPREDFEVRVRRRG
ncbi:MAG: hypothetical protein Q9227_003781 [Pyrenula ochraceoflavens]